MPGLMKTPYIPRPNTKPPSPPPLPFVLYECTRNEWIKAIRDGKISYNTQSLFFIKDTQEFYRGMTRYGVGTADGGLSVVSGLPSVSMAKEGTLYYNSQDQQFYTFSGGQFVNCLPIDTSNNAALSKLSTDLRIPSSKNVYRFVARNIKALYARVQTRLQEVMDRLSDTEKNISYLLDDVGIVAKLASLDQFRKIAAARLLSLTQSLSDYTKRTSTLEEKMTGAESKIAKMQEDIQILQEALKGQDDLRAEFQGQFDALNDKIEKLTKIDPDEDNLLRRTPNGLMAVQNWYEIHTTPVPPESESEPEPEP